MGRNPWTQRDFVREFLVEAETRPRDALKRLTNTAGTRGTSPPRTGDGMPRRRHRRLIAVSVLLVLVGLGIAVGLQSGNDSATPSVPFIGNATSIAVGHDNSVYFADPVNGQVGKIDLEGHVRTFAGTGRQGYSGDGGNALSARLYQPTGVAVAPDGTVYIADFGNRRIRSVRADGLIATVPGTVVDQQSEPSPAYLATGPGGSLYVEQYNRISGDIRIIRISSDGTITTLVGDGKQAMIKGAEGIAVAPDGTVYIADTGNHQIRRVGTDGRITIVAGPRAGIGRAVAVRSDGSVYLSYKDGIEMITSSGRLITVVDVSHTSRDDSRLLLAAGPGGSIFELFAGQVGKDSPDGIVRRVPYSE